MSNTEINNTPNFRRVPMGTKGDISNTLQFLSSCSSTMLKLYCTLQQESKWNKDEPHRYIDCSNIPFDNFFKLAKISKATGYANLRKLQEKGFIEINTYKNFLGEECKVIKLPINEEHTYVLCNLDLHLYRLFQKCCKPIVVKIYLFHCFMNSCNRGKSYSCSLPNIAKNIGYSKTNLEIITDCNNFLEEVRLLTIEKVWKEHEGIMNCYNVYTFHKEREILDKK